MERLERLQAAMAEAGLDALCLRGTDDIAWLTGFDGVFDGEQAHAVFVNDGRTFLLHTDSRYAQACRRAAGDGPCHVQDEPTSHAKWATDLARRCGAEALGIDDGITLAEFRSWEAAVRALAGEGREAPVLRETHEEVLRLRAVKDEREIERLRAAQAVTDAGFRHITGWMRPGVTERDVQVELEDYMRRHGADDLAFPSIVACGPNGASPHAVPGDARLEAGQCVVMDFGAKAAGYCSDMTRMVFVGEPDARLRDAYACLREANETVEAALRPGMTGAEAHQMALDVLEAGGYGGLMGHGVGHGVGLAIHELPVLSPRNPHPLRAGNVVTVEPGIYVAGAFGMRLEDCGVLRDDGYHPFSEIPHDLLVI